MVEIYIKNNYFTCEMAIQCYRELKRLAGNEFSNSKTNKI